jgi:hypothetical protein
MLRPLSFFGLIFVSVLFAANAFAVDPIICDPNQNAECQCPSGSVCSTSLAGRLTSPDDPNALRQLAGISSTWNGSLGVFEVSVDATQLSAEGVMKLNSNEGKWDSAEDLHDYVYELLGLSAECWEMDRPFPPLMIEQKGVVMRYDQFSEDWASAHVPSLIYAAITDAEGRIFIDGQQTDFVWDPGYQCTTGGDAYDEDSASGIVGRQCSTAISTEESHCVVEFDGQCFEEYNCVDVPKRMALTQISSYTAVTLDERFVCQGDFLNGDWVCSTSSTIIHVSGEVDQLELQNFYFKDEVGPYTDDLASEPNVSDLLEDSNIDDGVCGHGEVKDGQNNFSLETKAGWYDSTAPECTF